MNKDMGMSLDAKTLKDEVNARVALLQKDYVHRSHESNEFGIFCDENGVIQNGVFAGSTIAPDICEGNEDFKKLEKRIRIIDGIMIAVYAVAMIWMLYLYRTGSPNFNPRLFFMIFIPMAIVVNILLVAMNGVKKNRILKNAREYKAVLYDVRGRSSGRSTVKECEFAIWDNGKVRVIKEFIFHQPFNRISSIRKDQELIGQEFTVLASPDETGYCIRK